MDSNMKYATKNDWNDIMRNRSRLKMHELIERLGLRAKWSSNKRGKTNFDSPLVKELVSDMTNVVAHLPKDGDDLVEHLGAPNSLKYETDLLLEKHGNAIWGRMGDREHLVTVGEPDVESFYYPRDLYFENEEDRELIRTVLHWWIGMKACNVIHARGRLDRERRKKEERMRIKEEHPSPIDMHPPVLLAPAMPIDRKPIAPLMANPNPSAYYAQQPPRHQQVLRLDTASHGHPTPSASVSPLPSSESPIISAHAPTAQYSWRASPLARQTPPHFVPTNGARSTATPPAYSLQQLSVEVNNLAGSFTLDEPVERSPTPSTLPDHRGLDPETLAAFRKYIYPDEQGDAWDEEVLLRRLESAWRDHIRPAHTHPSANVSLFIARDRAFLTWLELRRHLADLERADKRWRTEARLEHEIEARVEEHKTLMAASRDIVRTWETIGQGVEVAWAPEGLSADELLMQAFMMLAGQNHTPDMVWPSMNVVETIKWLNGHLLQFSQDEALDIGSFYVHV
ncbi:hypothetical protein B0J11DRAFT_515772 [Dendryphion nanum]|uniref:Uncharacterized protein n=1 Tax=Dendryphion nanum TaxID=256645 RepID=A0A9P9EK72_9PLEO|nr:hypothetical protein B0J11DRAFT_515772 [Dendryphion nanum]